MRRRDGFAHAGVTVRVALRRNAHFCVRALNLPCRASSCLIWPLPCVFKKTKKKRKDHSLKKFSGLRPAHQDAACAFCIVFYSTNWPPGSESSGFYRVPGSGSRASQEAS